ncbi:MAG: small multi-drug export protein [Bacteroidia bacterium]
MWAYILKVLWVIGLSAVKYIGGFALALYDLEKGKLTIYETFIYNVAGGMLGVVIYLYLWHFIEILRKQYFPHREIHGVRINNRRRLLVKIVKRYELWGIVFLTPIFLTVPVGTIVAALIEKNKWKIKLMMLISFVGWTFVLLIAYLIVGPQIKILIPFLKAAD